MATAETTKPAAINPPIDPFAYFGITLNADGTLTRHDGPLSSPTGFHPSLSPVFTEDITFNTSNNTGVRLYINQNALESTSSNERLPIFIYFPGGAFIIGSPASPVYHNFCAFMAVELPAITVSVDYRLAPEHRLPAAYLDSVEVLQWIKTAPHEWLAKYGDLSKCYIMGASAGGNIAYHVPAFLRHVDLKPLQIKGMIMIHPFFSGTKRTESELKLVDDQVLPLIVNDMTWGLSLPVGADRDHEYCNPTVESELGACDWIKKAGWRVLVKGCGGDPLLDHQKEMVKLMQQKGVEGVVVILLNCLIHPMLRICVWLLRILCLLLLSLLFETCELADVCTTAT